MNFSLAGIAQGLQAAEQDQMAKARYKQAMEYQAWQMEQAKQQQARQTQAQQNYGSVLNAAFGGMAPPPVGGGQGPQPPAPGQASVPSAPPVSPNGGMGGMQMAQGFMPGESGGMPTRPPSVGAPATPPYQTVQSLAMRQAPQAGGMDLTQPPPMPSTNEIGTKPLSVAGVVQLLKAQGVPPEQWYDTMAEMKPLFDEQNKQELMQLKTQMDATKMANDVYKAMLSGQNIESLIKSREATPPKTREVKTGGQIQTQQWNAETKTWENVATAPRKMGGTGAGGVGDSGLPKGATPEGIRAETYAYLINNVSPPKRTGEYSAVMNDIAKLAKENNMSTEQLITAGADIKSRVLAKRSFEIRAQNIERAENVLLKEVPVFEDAIKDLSPSKFPALAKFELGAMRQGLAGQDALAKVTKMDQAAEVVFNEFNGIITGNPGTLNVADVQNAHKQYLAATTPAAAKAALDGMRRIIKNAKAANTETRQEIMGGVTSALRGAGAPGTKENPIKLD